MTDGIVVEDVDFKSNETKSGQRPRKIKRMSESWITEEDRRNDKMYCICNTTYDKRLQYIQCKKWLQMVPLHALVYGYSK